MYVKRFGKTEKSILFFGTDSHAHALKLELDYSKNAQFSSFIFPLEKFKNDDVIS